MNNAVCEKPQKMYENIEISNFQQTKQKGIIQCQNQTIKKQNKTKQNPENSLTIEMNKKKTYS